MHMLIGELLILKMAHVQSLRAKSPLHSSIAKSVLKQNIYTYTSLSKVKVEAGDG